MKYAIYEWCYGNGDPHWRQRTADVSLTSRRVGTFATAEAARTEAERLDADTGAGYRYWVAAVT